MKLLEVGKLNSQDGSYLKLRINADDLIQRLLTNQRQSTSCRGVNLDLYLGK